jgi:pilus assembly protein FimV
VLAVLQAAWPQPLDAMTELENLLFRKRSGELFELPAYRDVLALYSVARDLHRQLDQPAHDVDVLLPLGVSEAASPSIFDSLGSGFPDGAADDRPTAPVDLDLSEPTTASSAAPAR